MPGKDASPFYPEQPVLPRAAPSESCKQLLEGGGGSRLVPELHSGLFILNHSVVSLCQRLGMDTADPKSFPHCGHRTFAGAWDSK